MVFSKDMNNPIDALLGPCSSTSKFMTKLGIHCAPFSPLSTHSSTLIPLLMHPSSLPLCLIILCYYNLVLRCCIHCRDLRPLLQPLLSTTSGSLIHCCTTTPILCSQIIRSLHLTVPTLLKQVHPFFEHTTMIQGLS